MIFNEEEFNAIAYAYRTCPPNEVELVSQRYQDLVDYVLALMSQEQEPVAWIEPITKSLLTNEDAVNNQFCNLNSVWKPLYTHPATWQSLSDDEIEKFADKVWIKWRIHDVDMIDFARAIEQALKEKNK